MSQPGRKFYELKFIINLVKLQKTTQVLVSSELKNRKFSAPLSSLEFIQSVVSCGIVEMLYINSVTGLTICCVAEHDWLGIDCVKLHVQQPR